LKNDIGETQLDQSNPTNKLIFYKINLFNNSIMSAELIVYGPFFIALCAFVISVIILSLMSIQIFNDPRCRLPEESLCPGYYQVRDYIFNIFLWIASISALILFIYGGVGWVASGGG